MRLDVTIPANTRAIVTCRGRTASQVLESGVPLCAGRGRDLPRPGWKGHSS